MSDQSTPEMDQKVADYLRSTGRGDVADQLERPAAPDPEPEVDEGEQFLADLKAARDRGKVSLPGLLDA